jgi:hypothetical protein
MRVNDPGLAVGLLMLIAGVSVVIIGPRTYDSIDRKPYFFNQTSNTSASSVSHAGTFDAAFQPGTLLAKRCALHGVVNCFSFDNADNLYYTWPTGTVCDKAFKGLTNYKFGKNRQGWGNAVAVVQNGQCIFPEIDSTTSHSGTGSLKITIPSNSSADSGGHFTEVFKRNRSGKPDGTYIGPGSSLGNVLFFQFYQKFDDNFLSTVYQCLGGGCGGWKQIINFGNPPNGASSSSLEVTMNNGWQRGVPQMYGQQGSDYYGIQDVRGCTYNFNGLLTYPEPPCIRYKANQWMEFTGRIEILGESNQPTSHVQLWVDGELAIDYKQAKIDWSGPSGKGFGQFLLSPYHTNKDASQVHPAGHVWYDDLIISTEPIPMGSVVQ